MLSVSLVDHHQHLSNWTFHGFPQRPSHTAHSSSVVHNPGTNLGVYHQNDQGFLSSNTLLEGHVFDATLFRDLVPQQAVTYSIPGTVGTSYTTASNVPTIGQSAPAAMPPPPKPPQHGNVNVITGHEVTTDPSRATKGTLDWETAREEIRRYYIEEGKTLPETKKLMAENYLFNASSVHPQLGSRVLNLELTLAQIEIVQDETERMGLQ